MKLLKSFRFVFGIYMLIAVIICIQHYSLGTYNNFTIFQHSSFHFFSHQNPYLEYPAEYDDLFLYNPSFIILFIPFAYLPTSIGILLWLVFILTLYFLAIKRLPIADNAKLFIYYLVIPELITSATNLQTNCLLAAFILFSMLFMEKNEPGKASVFPALNFFIKGYGGIAAIFFLLKKPAFKSFLYLGISFLVVGLLPLLFYTPAQFILLYQQWFVSLSNDYAVNIGLSVMGIIKSTFYKTASVPIIQLTGVFIFLTSVVFIFIRKSYEQVKYYFLASVLIWVIIFNQSAESATYIIASTGVFIWYVNSAKKGIDKVLFILFYLLTVMSSSDFFPRYIREHLVEPYSLKALPCVLIWVRIQFLLFSTNHQLSHPHAQ